MTRLDWAGAPRTWRGGVSHGVLYSDGPAVPWNGLVAVHENPSGSQSLDAYFDGQRLIIAQEIGDFEGTLEAFTYPDEFREHSGELTRPSGKRFGLSWREGSSDGDKLHILYNALVREPNRSWKTVAGRPDPSAFLWNLQASAINVPGARPASHLIVDTADALPELVAVVEGWLYGTADTEPRLPTPEELVDIFEAATLLRISYNPDGTWTAEGPDSVLRVNGDGSFDISAPTAQFLDLGIFTVDSF